MHESALAAFGISSKSNMKMHELEHRMGEAAEDLDKVLELYSVCSTS